MAFIEEGRHWIIGSVGLVFVLVGASKWLYDVVIMNNFAHWKIYLVMMMVGAICVGYMKLEKIAEKVVGKLGTIK